MLNFIKKTQKNNIWGKILNLKESLEKAAKEEVSSDEETEIEHFISSEKELSVETDDTVTEEYDCK